MKEKGKRKKEEGRREATIKRVGFKQESNIKEYASFKAGDIPGTPLKKGGTRLFSKSPLLSGDLGGSPGHKHF